MIISPILSLSREIKKYTIITYAYCSDCEILYHDDVSGIGYIICPKCNEKTLARGLTPAGAARLIIEGLPTGEKIKVSTNLNVEFTKSY